MEPRKEISSTELEAWRPDPASGPHGYFRAALAFVRGHYAEELRGFSSVSPGDVGPDRFFLEYVWVVHATGFNAGVVGRMMPRLLAAYGHWSALARKEEHEVLRDVLPVCNNPGKAKAVRRGAKLLRDGVDAHGWERFRDEDLSSPEKLRRFPYIGPVTCFHLARNIGLLEFVKPDLHLVRMAGAWAFEDPVAMCGRIRDRHLEETGERLPLGIVDLVLWYAASTFGTLGMRGDGR